ncbi:MAG: hypothetical protein QM704_13925 [Anaeromyxobacteraceae bacterium]
MTIRRLAAGCAAALAAAALSAARAEEPGQRQAPARLEETGLYADFAARRVAADVLTWTPQYPLWSDGATKRRFVRLPPGKAIDATEPDAWVFPVGTKLWKEFSFGRAVETRYMERRQDGSWIFATYRWTEDGKDAVLAPNRGVLAAAELRPARAGAPAVSHDLPSMGDCISCHTAGPTPVLGFSALQLSPDRDPNAPHREAGSPRDVDLPELAGRGLLVDLPPALLRRPPRVEAPTPTARAALGYLHGNCASCHDARGDLASLGLDLTQRVEPTPGAGPLATAVNVPSRYRPAGARGAVPRIAPGDPERSALVARISSRNPSAQMPPMGTHLVDDEAVKLVRAFVEELDAPGRRVAQRP